MHNHISSIFVPQLLPRTQANVELENISKLHTYAMLVSRLAAQWGWKFLRVRILFVCLFVCFKGRIELPCLTNWIQVQCIITSRQSLFFSSFPERKQMWNQRTYPNYIPMLCWFSAWQHNEVEFYIKLYSFTTYSPQFWQDKIKNGQKTVWKWQKTLKPQWKLHYPVALVIIALKAKWTTTIKCSFG